MITAEEKLSPAVEKLPVSTFLILGAPKAKWCPKHKINYIADTYEYKLPVEGALGGNKRITAPCRECRMETNWDRNQTLTILNAVLNAVGVSYSNTDRGYSIQGTGDLKNVLLQKIKGLQALLSLVEPPA